MEKFVSGLFVLITFFGSVSGLMASFYIGSLGLKTKFGKQLRKELYQVVRLGEKNE